MATKAPKAHKRISWWVVLGSTICVALATGLPQLFGHAWNNFGHVTLFHSTAVRSQEVFTRQKWGQAEVEFRRALLFDPNNQSAWRGLGVVLAVEGSFTEAAELRKIFGVPDPIFAASVINVLDQVGHGEQALALWRAVGSMGQVFIGIGDEASQGNSFEVAERWYKQATIVEPDLADTWFSLGLLYERNGKADDADSAYRRAALSHIFKTIGRSSPWCGRGRVRLQLLAPTNLDVAVAMFEVATDTNDFATDLEAADCNFHQAEALSRIDMTANLDKIVASCIYAVEHNPDHVLARVLLGVSYDKQNRIADAEREFTSAIKTAPRYSWSYYYLAQLREKTGKVGEAIDLYQEALLINPGLDAAKARLATLQNQK